MAIVDDSVDTTGVLKASQAEAEAGVIDTKYLTPLTGSQAIASLASGGEKDSGNNVIGVANKKTTAGNYTTDATENLVTGGDFTIASGHTITVTSGSSWTIVGS